MNPLNREDAEQIQRRLAELGYYAGSDDGVWGAASRNALRGFKTVNRLANDDEWDAATANQRAAASFAKRSGLQYFGFVLVECFAMGRGDGGFAGPSEYLRPGHPGHVSEPDQLLGRVSAGPGQGERFSAERIMPLIEAIYQGAIANEKQSWPVSLASSNDRVEVIPND